MPAGSLEGTRQRLHLRAGHTNIDSPCRNRQDLGARFLKEHLKVCSQIVIADLLAAAFLKIIAIIGGVAKGHGCGLSSERSLRVAIHEAVSAEHSVPPQDPELPRSRDGHRGWVRDIFRISTKILRRQVRQNPIQLLGTESDN